MVGLLVFLLPLSGYLPSMHDAKLNRIGCFLFLEDPTRDWWQDPLSPLRISRPNLDVPVR